MIFDRERPVYEALDALSIPYTRYEHGEARTMEALASFDTEHHCLHCKNLFLCNRQGTVFYLLLLVGEKKFRTAEVSKQLGVSRLSFATPEQLKSLLGLTPGEVTPMSLVNEKEPKVIVLLDRDILKEERLLVHPNVCTASIELTTADLLKFLNSRGNRIEEVTLSDTPLHE